MKKHAFFALLLFTLVIIFNISSTFAAEANSSGTLSNIKTISKTILSSNKSVYTLTEVTSDTTVPENAVTVKIDGKTYYYVPNTTGTLTQKDYQRLASTGHVALKELTSSDGAIYKVGDKYYGYDVDKLPKSAYTLTEVSSSGADTISYRYFDSTSNTYVTKYYKIALNNSSSGDSLTWSEDSTGSTGSVKITLPNGTEKTYYYTYTTPSGYTETSTRVTSPNSSNVSNKVFKNITSSSNINGAARGALYNTSSNSSLNITSDFVQNGISDSWTTQGGAINNEGGSFNK